VEVRPVGDVPVRPRVMINGVVVQGKAAVVEVPAGEAPAAGKKEAKEEEKKEDDGEEKDGEGTIPGTTRAVFFDEDRELGARLRKAEQLRDAGRLQEAFDLYLWVLESGDEALFRLDEHRLTGVRDHCMRKIAELPADFLTQYRLRMDGEVGRLFDEAKTKVDASTLESLGQRYYLSSYGPEIMDHAGDVYAGRGETDRAAGCWRRMLKWGTGRVARELIETKLVLVLSRAGKRREAGAVLEGMRERGAATRVTLGGTEREAVAFLDQTLPKSGETPVRTVAVNRRHWPQLGGESGHGQSMPARFQCDVKVSEFPIEGYDWKKPPSNVQVRGFNPVQQAQFLQGYAPFLPVYAGGRIFIHDEGGVMAFRLNAISEDWTVGELSLVNANVRGQPMYFNPAAGSRGWVCAWADGVVYASFHKGGEASVWAVSEQGKILWQVTRNIVGWEWLSGVSSVSDPVVYEGSVFFLVWKGDAYRHDCTLVSVDATTGKLLWKEFICAGAQMPSYYYRGAMRPLVSVNVPAASDGVVVACSDLGGIAALDARSGEFRWGFAYEQYAANYRNFFVPNRGVAPPATPAVSLSAPVIHEGVVYVTPRDSTGLYAIDLDTGRCLWQKPCGSGNSILGVTGEHVLTAGTMLTAWDAFSGEVVWQNDDLVATGQGFVTEDAVYLPTAEAIRRYDPASGKLQGRLLVDESAGEFGSLLLVEDTMVQVGRTAGFYGVWERVHTKLAAEIARNPADHEPHVKLGAIYARKEDRGEAIRSYERALDLMIHLDEPRHVRERAEIRNRLYDLYQAEIERDENDNRLDRALTRARRIGTYATTDERQIEAVVMLIRLHEKRGEWSSVVRQYQSFLEHPPKIVYAFDGSSSMLPTLHARLKIRELIARHGRTVYAEFDDRAAELYRRGKPEDFEKVTAVYPNSTSALRALKRLSEVEAEAGHYRKA
ncbi:MAG TPA: PQQ-binding-like beta-propeller repeat protein, partial [Planctomycetota bacterium]|nr:PQQ-binding-like beta-propeller repeat protein [Planctomycetota bacterium]